MISLAMKLKDVIRAEKLVTDWGKWQEGGKMPRSAFCLSKSRDRSYRLGAFRWRIVCFQALGHAFRLLVAYRIDKEQYRAVLAVETERDLTVIAQYEFHGTHPGWHILATCEEITDAPAGVMRHPWQRRIPGARKFSRRTTFGIVDDNQALSVAADRFRLHRSEGLLV